MVRGGISAGVLLVCLSTSCAPASATGLIDARLLAPASRDLPGFHGAHRRLYWSFSAFEWGHGGNEGDEQRAKHETAELIESGFFEAVSAVFVGRSEGRGQRREASSEAIVFATEQGARQVLANRVAESVDETYKPALRRFTASAIPGSLGVGGYLPGKPRAEAALYFAIGRCYVMVDAGFPRGRSWARAERTPIAAAIRIDRRARTACA